MKKYKQINNRQVLKIILNKKIKKYKIKINQKKIKIIKIKKYKMNKMNQMKSIINLKILTLLTKPINTENHFSIILKSKKSQMKYFLAKKFQTLKEIKNL